MLEGVGLRVSIELVSEFGRQFVCVDVDVVVEVCSEPKRALVVVARDWRDSVEVRVAPDVVHSCDVISEQA